MTIEEFSQIYYINMEIKSIQLEIYELRQKNFYKKNIISDMPRGGQGIDVNMEFVNSIMDLEELLNYNLKKLQEERRKMEEFLSSIEDHELRVILRLRCVNNMRWDDIGFELSMDRRTVSRKFYGYFE